MLLSVKARSGIAQAAALVTVLSVAGWAAAPAGDVDAVSVAMVPATTALVLTAIVAWGTHSAWSWIVAALSYMGLAALRSAVYGFVWQERVAGAFVGQDQGAAHQHSGLTLY